MADQFDPEKVERFDPELSSYFYGGEFATMTEHPQGEYVKAPTYASLLAEYNRLKIALARIEQEKRVFMGGAMEEDEREYD